MWYLIYNADKFEAVSRQKPVLLRMDEFMGPESTAFPAEVYVDSLYRLAISDDGTDEL